MCIRDSWWLDQAPNVTAFTLSMVFPAPPEAAEAVHGLVERHPALRMRLTDGRLEVLPYDPAAVRVERVDASGESDPMDLVRHLAESARIDPAAEPMLRAVLIATGPGRPDLLLLTAHHLAVDGVSWRVLGSELAGGDTPPAGTSFRHWAKALHREARRPALAAAGARRWAAALAGPEARFNGGAAPAGARAAHTFELSEALTARVLNGLPAAFGCGPDAVLLTALTQAAARRRGTGSGLLVHLEGHGREPLAEPADVSHTVGWFVTQYPMRLDPGDAATPRAALEAVKEQLRTVPDGRLSWGLLRYLNPATAPALAALPEPDIRFNYLGRFAEGDAAGGELLSVGLDTIPLGHALEVDVLAHERAGGLRLEVSFSYATGLLTEPEVRAFADSWTAALELLAADAELGGPVAASPSDFPLVDLTPEQLGLLEAELGDLSCFEDSLEVTR